MKTIIHTVDMQAKPDAVYKAIATQQGLSGWWTSQVKGEERVGGVLAFAFMDGFGPQMRVTKLESPGLVTWEGVAGPPSWIGSRFRFEIVSHDAGVRLRFRQEYVKDLDEDEFGTYNYNWAYFLESLRLYTTTGTGKPFVPQQVVSSAR
ncbi:MAG: SRPBCC domain-containing protein [Candidatus Dormibacteraeota bacterium]|nr:SRPBCC domain-containing protein [Candidatus Dormibacteraeota bacterium]